MFVVLKSARGAVAVPEPEGCLTRVREQLERYGVEVTSASPSELVFRSPLDVSAKVPLPSSYGSALWFTSGGSVRLITAGGQPAWLQFEVSVSSAYHLALFFSLFLLPLLVLVPLTVAATGAPWPWLGMALLVAANAINVLFLLHTRAHAASAFRSLLASALSAPHSLGPA